METTLVESTHRRASFHSIERSMHVWKLPVPNGAAQFASALELELTASHTSDLNHLDPSCPACRRLRTQLEAAARAAVQGISIRMTEIAFEIYTDPARIVCSPANGQRPSVTVSIYVWDRSSASTENGAASAISQLQRSLAAFGVRAH